MILPALLALTVSVPASQAVPPVARAVPTAARAPGSSGPAAAPPPETAEPVPTRRPSGLGVATTALLTADNLRAKCEDSSAVVQSYCYAYIAGVYDSIRAYETWLNMREFCRPVRVAQSDLRRAFLDYLRTNPQAASGEAASVVVIAFRQKFACSGPIGSEPAK